MRCRALGRRAIEAAGSSGCQAGGLQDNTEEREREDGNRVARNEEQTSVMASAGS